MQIRYHHLGVATVLLQLGEVTLITDPCLDEADGWRHHGWGALSRKTEESASVPADIEIDGALVSHGHHWDNLDDAGRELLRDVAPILTTAYTARSMEGAVGLTPGDSYTVEGDTVSVTVTAVSAQHGVFPLSVLAGPVIGFVLEVEPSGTTIYISGDTLYTRQVVTEVNGHDPADLFIPHLGNASFPFLSGPIRYTMNLDDLRQFLAQLRPQFTLPVHNDGWSHFRSVAYQEAALEQYTTILHRPAGTIETE